MLILCMRTTVNLDDELLRVVRQRAAQTGRTMTEMMELALRELLERESRPASGYRFRWVSVRGRAQPALDLTNRDALLDRVEDLE
jgi:plasmid stability protein